MTVTLNDIQASFHSIKISDGTDTLAIDGSGNITVAGIVNDVNIADGGNSITVDATALDIRALTNADVVTVEDGGGSITVDATALDIRALTNADVVTIEDGGGSITVDGAVSTLPGGYGSWKVTDQDATNTASELAATPLTGRLAVEVQNVGAVDTYVNFSNAVTTANGLLIPKGSSWSADLDDGANIWAITAAGTADLRIVEYAA